MADPFAAALDTLYAHSGVDVTIPFPPTGAGPLTVRALYEEFDPANPPIGSEISEWRTGENRAVFGFRGSEVTDLPIGTLFETTDPDGGTPLTWKVESLVRRTANAMNPKKALEIKVLCRQVR